MSKRKTKAAELALVVEIQDELPLADDLNGALQCAADCYTLDDLCANLDDAIFAAEELARELAVLLAQAKVKP